MGQRYIIPVMGQSFLSKMDVMMIELAIMLLYDYLSLCLERTYVYCKCSNR